MPAKKSTTKTAAKKVAVKKTALTTIEDPDTLPLLRFKKKFNLADAGVVAAKMADNVRKSVDVVTNRSKTRPVSLLTPAMLRKMLLEYDDILLQHAIGSVGFRVPSTIEIIAPEHVGKTTFCFDWIGRLAASGCYSLYIECEGKMMADKRIKRLMHPDKKIAAALMNTVTFATARTLVECDEVIVKTVQELRKRCDDNADTKGNPIWVFIDPWSGLMSSAEAKGRNTWGLGATAKKETAKDAGTGSNMGHAKHAQIMKRWLPDFLEKNNVVCVFVNHQNAKVDMGGFKPPGLPAPSESTNDTTIGGRALRQFSAYRFIMTSKGDIKDKDRTPIGLNVQISVKKNSYGARGRKASFSLYFDRQKDTATHFAPTISYAAATAEWMAQNRLLDTTVSNGLYTCDTLGCVAVSPEVLYDKLKGDYEQLNFVGAALDIEGYESEVSAAKRDELLTNFIVDEPDGDEEETEAEEGEDNGEA